jgi:peroxiredoxin
MMMKRTGLLLCLSLAFLEPAFCRTTGGPQSLNTMPAAVAQNPEPTLSLVTPSPSTAPKVGFLAPDFSLEQPDGSSIRLSDLRGSPVFINFWNIACQYCRYEMPNIQRMHATYSDKGLVVLGVNEEDAAEDVLVYMDRMKLNYRMVLDRDSRVGHSYLVQGLPYSCFIDSDGIIQSIYIGELSRVKMEQLIQKIVE